MAKGGSGLAASVWKAGRSALNSAAPWPRPEAAQARVLGIQRKLHKWAEDDQDRRFSDLHNLVCDPATLMVAWQRVLANRGSRSAGVDRQNAYDIERRLGVERFLGGLREELRAGSFRPEPVRERVIPIDSDGYGSSGVGTGDDLLGGWRFRGVRIRLMRAAWWCGAAGMGSRGIGASGGGAGRGTVIRPIGLRRRRSE